MTIMDNPNTSNEDTNVTADIPSAFTPIVTGGLRDIAKGVGALVIATGVANDSQVTMYSGIFVVIGSVIWSGYVNWQKHKQLTIAHTAIATLAPANNVSPADALNDAELKLIQAKASK